MTWRFKRGTEFSVRENGSSSFRNTASCGGASTRRSGRRKVREAEWESRREWSYPLSRATAGIAQRAATRARLLHREGDRVWVDQGSRGRGATDRRHAREVDADHGFVGDDGGGAGANACDLLNANDAESRLTAIRTRHRFSKSRKKVPRTVFPVFLAYGIPGRVDDK